VRDCAVAAPSLAGGAEREPLDVGSVSSHTSFGLSRGCNKPGMLEEVKTILPVIFRKGRILKSEAMVLKWGRENNSNPFPPDKVHKF
jgi:hypothetical protein